MEMNPPNGQPAHYSILVNVSCSERQTLLEQRPKSANRTLSRSKPFSSWNRGESLRYVYLYESFSQLVNLSWVPLSPASSAVNVDTAVEEGDSGLDIVLDLFTSRCTLRRYFLFVTSCPVHFHKGHENIEKRNKIQK